MGRIILPKQQKQQKKACYTEVLTKIKNKQGWPKENVVVRHYSISPKSPFQALH